MSYTLETKAFFFNAKTDYLPYYKHFKFTLPYDATAKEILAAIKAQNENFSYPHTNLVFRINDLIVEATTPLSEIVKRLGTQLQIDPANSYRSTNGLIFNDEDFMQSFSLLAPYATQKDEAYYKTLYPLHYASETEKFDHSYIGDAILVLAHRMIQEGNIHKKEILKAISSTDASLFACEYENNLFDAQDHTDAIEALKKMANSHEDDGSLSLFERIKAYFNTHTKKEEKKVTLQKPRVETEIENLENKQIAYYAGTNSKNETHITNAIKHLGCKMVDFSRKYKRCGYTLLQAHKRLALRKAGAILLDAYDAGAEVLIIEEEESYEMFRRNFKAIEHAIGREIPNLDLITAKGFLLQSEAIKQK